MNKSRVAHPAKCLWRIDQHFLLKFQGGHSQACDAPFSVFFTLTMHMNAQHEKSARSEKKVLPWSRSLSSGDLALSISPPGPRPEKQEFRQKFGFAREFETSCWHSCQWLLLLLLKVFRKGLLMKRDSKIGRAVFGWERPRCFLGNHKTDAEENMKRITPVQNWWQMNLFTHQHVELQRKRIFQYCWVMQQIRGHLSTPVAVLNVQLQSCNPAFIAPTSAAASLDSVRWTHLLWDPEPSVLVSLPSQTCPNLARCSKSWSLLRWEIDSIPECFWIPLTKPKADICHKTFSSKCKHNTNVCVAFVWERKYTSKRNFDASKLKTLFGVRVRRQTMCIVQCFSHAQRT